MASIAARSRRRSLVIAAATGPQLAAICAATAAHESEAMRANRVVEANLAAGMNHLSWLGKAGQRDGSSPRRGEPGGSLMIRLAQLVQAENRADADRRAAGRVPDVLRQPGAAHEAHAWKAARHALTEAREAGTDREAGE